MNAKNYLLGLDIGSSSVKASLVDVDTGTSVVAAQSPREEMAMDAAQAGWAEQDPNLWWEHVINSVRQCLSQSSADANSIKAIGISYQMHGLVIVDKDLQPLRPSIIWCDSRAVAIGEKAFSDLGKDYCLRRLLNSPGNFTAAKLAWVKANEPQVYSRIYKMMLPGDFIALKMSGEVTTTETGLSEGVFWDYHDKKISEKLLAYFGLNESHVGRVVPVFSKQCELSKPAASALGLQAGTPISYRAGDQPNNAFSLNVIHPGETAATAGTSGVVYSVTGDNAFDPMSRVNTFIHVSNEKATTRNGVLLCVNGTGIQNSWLRKNIRSGSPYDYAQMNSSAAEAPIGSGGVVVLPFGNGAERILGNQEIGGSLHGVNFNIHNQSHLFRAAQEGIVFALRYGFDILSEMGVRTKIIRAGNANMFLSPVFREAFVNSLGARLELYDTDGSKGAAVGAGVGAGIYANFKEAFRGLRLIDSTEPDQSKKNAYETAYQKWKNTLNSQVLQ